MGSKGMEGKFSSGYWTWRSGHDPWFWTTKCWKLAGDTRGGRILSVHALCTKQVLF